MQKITPFLWFDNQAEQAANFYTSVFQNSKLGQISRYGEAGPGPEGSVMTIGFELEGIEFTALNGGPLFQFNESVSFVINCESQEEVDHYWDRLSEDGAVQQCGWLKDKYGVSWQVVPTRLVEMLGDPDAEKRRGVTEAMLQMIKLDLGALERAFGNEQ